MSKNDKAVEMPWPRMTLDAFKAGCQGRVCLANGTVITDDKLIQAALDSIDQKALFKEVDADFVAVEWDRRMSINGAAAAKVLLAQRANIPAGGLIYLIKRVSTDRVMFFQPMVPGASGIVPLTRANIDEVSAAHRAGVVQAVVLSAVKRRTLDKLAELSGN